MKHIPIENGLTVHLLQTRKFKTTVITVLIRTELSKLNATRNALLAGILRSGCKEYPSALEIAKQCEEMYGAIFDVGVVKKGEEHIIQLYYEVLDDRFCYDGAEIFEQAGKLLNNILFEPLTVNGAFEPEYIRIQKELLRQVIEGKINDKKKYALERLVEIMCADEPFGVPGDGYIEHLKLLTPECMYEYYSAFIEQSPIEIAIIGDFDTDCCKSWANKYFARKSRHIDFLKPAVIIKPSGKLKEVREDLNISQGKLVIGARCDFPSKGDDFYKLLLFNEVLGGGPNSKLFKSIRERHSLCYYVNSFIYRAKAILIIQAGIDEKDYPQTMRLILNEIDEIKHEGITGDALALAKSAMINRIETLKDSPQGITDFYMTNILLEDKTEISDMRGIFEKFTEDEICACAEKIEFDTAYFLA